MFIILRISFDVRVEFIRLPYQTRFLPLFSLVCFFQLRIHLNFLAILIRDYFEAISDLVLGVLQHIPELFIFLLDRHDQLQRHLGKWSVFASYLEHDF